MTNKHENKYENLVVHCKSKQEWDWVFDNLPEGYSDPDNKRKNYNSYLFSCIHINDNCIDFDGIRYYQVQLANKTGLVKGIISLFRIQTDDLGRQI